MTGRADLVRDPDSEHASVDFVELFFDLVYVFAVTQISHFLIGHQGGLGLLQAAILFLAVWWAWTFTTWATNWLDPTRVAVRIMVFCVMLASLVMSASLPDAFGDRALWFAIAYVTIQVGRTLFVSWVMWNARPRLGVSLLRVAGWFLVTTPLWIGGALLDPTSRLLCWGLALLLEYAAPVFQFALPVLGRSQSTDYAVSGAHMAERCALLIIIALGEGVLVTGASFADRDWNTPTIAAASVAFVGTIAMWWVYFDVGMRRGAKHIEREEDSGRVARNAYTYSHLPIVAGIVISAVADELLLEHPLGHSSATFMLSALGGPALFLAGTMIFKKVTSGQPWFPLSHIVGLAMFAIAGLWAWLARPTPVAIGAVGVGVLVAVAAWEWGSFHGGWVERGLKQPAILRRRAERLFAKWQESDKSVSPTDD